VNIALYKKPISDLRCTTCHMESIVQCYWPHDTSEQWTCPTFIPAIQTGTWFTYPRGMEDLTWPQFWLYTKMV